MALPTANVTRDVRVNPWTREELLAKLWDMRNSRRTLERAMIQLYSRQTRDEQAVRDTRHHNGVGFSAFHAKTGSMLGAYAQDGGTFGPTWQRKAFNICKVHIGQLVDIANGVESVA